MDISVDQNLAATEDIDDGNINYDLLESRAADAVGTANSSDEEDDIKSQTLVSAKDAVWHCSMLPKFLEQGTDTSKLQKKLQDIERYSTRMRIYNGTNILTKDVFPVNDASCLLCTPYVYNWNVVSICAKLIWYYLFIPVMYLYTVNLFSIIVFFNAPLAYNVCLFDCILFVIFVVHTVCYFCYAYCLLFLLLCKYILLTEVFYDVCLHFVFMISFLICEKIK